MVVQPAGVPVDPGETADLTARVVCIHSAKAVPEALSAYDLGQLAEGHLAKFAASVCQENLSRSVSPLKGWDRRLDGCGRCKPG